MSISSLAGSSAGGSKEDGSLAHGSPAAAMGLTRCLSAVHGQDACSLEDATARAAAVAASLDAWRCGKARSLPRAIGSRPPAATLGCRQALHGDSDMHMHRQDDDEDDRVFRPPHEVVAGSFPDEELRSSVYSLTLHRTTADRLKSVVFEQTGHVCSGMPSRLL